MMSGLTSFKPDSEAWFEQYEKTDSCPHPWQFCDTSYIMRPRCKFRNSLLQL